MINETATKISVEFNHIDQMLYGGSAMSRFITLPNIPPAFNFQESFSGLKFQRDKKSKEGIYGISEVSGVNQQHYNIGYAQFEDYSDFFEAVAMSGKQGIGIEAVNPFPVVSNHLSKESIDKEFAEVDALKRPRATYIYSLALNPGYSNQKACEVASIATNNRFFQSQDHCMATYSLLKLTNFFK